MEDSPYTQSSSYYHSRNADFHAASISEHVPNGDGSTVGAKYRLRSPAQLPISRSTCITIPPGLSPTSFLESPVLLSNMKAEPSPTTGSFFKPQLMKESIENAASLEQIRSGGNSADERMSSSFEFRFHTGSSSTLELGSTGLVHEGFNPMGHVAHQHPHYSQFPSPSSGDSKSGAVATHDSLGCTTTNESTQGGPSNNSLVCRSFDELNHRGHSEKGHQVSSVELKDTASVASSSNDGYNWRKYGQKLVKGSEFPRSYYKCTHPNCEVKKIFECSPSGRITEIVYKGTHDHPKPQIARRQNPGAVVSSQEDKWDKDSASPGLEDMLNTSSMEPSIPPMLSSMQADEDDDVEEDPFQKRRKMEAFVGVTSIIQPIREPRVVVQTVSEVDILDDGYRWRKYGQKVVRGNPNPRSYYKCTNNGCPVRKLVERASHDPKAVITTYEGKHNHEVPTARNSTREFAQYSGMLKMRPENSNSSITLDLSVGINHIVESNISVMGPPQIPAYYSNGGLNVFGTRENRFEGNTYQNLQQELHPSTEP